MSILLAASKLLVLPKLQLSLLFPEVKLNGEGTAEEILVLMKKGSYCRCGCGSGALPARGESHEQDQEN